MENQIIMEDALSHEFPILVALQGPLEGRRWVIQSSLVIGRDTECAITIEDRQVSRHHARVINENNICFIEDLGSKNGTFFSGKQIAERTRLNDGDIVQIAIIQKFAFYNSDATMPIEDLDPALFRYSGKLMLDEKARQVWIGGRELVPALSSAQFRLLVALYEQTGKVVPREDLVTKIWQEEEASGVSEQALDALIRRLRDRLAELDDTHQYIVTVRGHGTRLDNPSSF